MRTAAAQNLTDPAVPSGRLVAADGREMPLKSTRLRANACGGLARVVVEQHFENPYAEALTVAYALPLPHAGAVSGFAFRIGERRVVGEIDRVETARDRYEEALMEGRTTALLEQDRGSLFHQEVGNVPPGEAIVAEVTVDQPLDWLPEGAWEWRFPTVVAPRYLGAPGRTSDARRLSQEVTSASTTGPALGLELQIRDMLRGTGRPESTSHRISSHQDGVGTYVTLDGGAKDTLDRDLVVRWPVAEAEPALAIDVAQPRPEARIGDRAYGLLTLVPPRLEALQDSAPFGWRAHPLVPRRFRRAPAWGPVPRDLILLLDTSGSMYGEPLLQAKAVARALVERLESRDSLELVAFSSAPERWRSQPQPVSDGVKAAALAWIDGLEAGGGTEMVSGMLEALQAPRSASQRQVVLITDGLVGFEEEVVASVAAKLPTNSRLHCVGVGPASNRSLTGPCAQAGRGIEVLVGLEESVERCTDRLLARLQAPVVTDLSVTGSALDELADPLLPDLFLGAPARVALAIRPTGGELTVRGRTAIGPWSTTITVPPSATASGGEAVTALFGRARVEHLELERAGGTDREAIDQAIEAIGLQFAIATRRTSWVAVSEAFDVDAQAPIRKVRQPQQLPRGLSAEGLGLVAFASSRLPGVLASRTADQGDDIFAQDEINCLLSSVPESREFEVSRFGSTNSDPAHFRAIQPGKPQLSAFISGENDGELLLLVQVESGTLGWSQPFELDVVWNDGSEEPLRLVCERSTHDCTVAEGALLRLYLLLPDNRTASEVAIVKIPDDGGRIFAVPVGEQS